MRKSRFFDDSEYKVETGSHKEWAMLREIGAYDLACMIQDLDKELYEAKQSRVNHYIHDLKKVLERFQGCSFTKEQMEDINRSYLDVFGPAFCNIKDSE